MLSTLGASAAGVTTSACTTQKLGADMLDAGNVVSSQAVQNLASQSSQYQAAVAGYNSTFTGYADEYNTDPTNCTVSWHDAAANFLLQSTKGKYIVVVAEDPRLGIVYSVTEHGYTSASISPTNSTTYSGYAIANNSAGSQSIDYSTAFWYIPDLSGPSGAGQPHCLWSVDTNTECDLSVWTGLQNNTYNGNPRTFTGTNVVLQTGTQGNYTCNHGNCYVKAWGWSEWLKAGNSAATPRILDCSFDMSQGDGMSAEVGSQLQINGTSGSTYYTILIDESLDRSCQAEYLNLSYPVPTPYYAMFIAERPQPNANWFALPKFETFEFEDVGMGTGSSQFGAYPNYNNNWGFGSYMKNINTTTSVWTPDTTTSSMSTMGGGSVYGQFTETYDSSLGTY